MFGRLREGDCKMPRNFLAPYRFKIVGNCSQNFLNFLQNNQGNHYTNAQDQTTLILDSVNIQGNRAWGNLQYGRYGAKSPVVDVTTQQVTKTIEPNESPLYDYFYLIEYDSRSNGGYMLLQRIGNIGVRTAFSEALRNWGLNVRIEPVILGLKELLSNPIMEFRIKIPKKPTDVDSRLEKLKIENEEEMYVEVSIKSRRNRFLQLADSIRQALSNNDLSNIGYIYDEDEEINIVVKVGKSQRTINITKGRVRTWIEVENVDNIKYEAEQLLKEIKKENSYVRSD